jgi:mono/diheme cytochrome c family protein
MISARLLSPPQLRSRPSLRLPMWLIVSSFSLTVCFSNGAEATPADPSHGARLARQWCASCHVVAPDQRGTVAEAPPFATIARKPHFDTAQLALFLLDPHPKMPDMALTRVEAADLAAYIASLK